MTLNYAKQAFAMESNGERVVSLAMMSRKAFCQVDSRTKLLFALEAFRTSGTLFFSQPLFRFCPLQASSMAACYSLMAINSPLLRGPTCPWVDQERKEAKLPQNQTGNPERFFIHNLLLDFAYGMEPLLFVAILSPEYDGRFPGALCCSFADLEWWSKLLTPLRLSARLRLFISRNSYLVVGAVVD